MIGWKLKAARNTHFPKLSLAEAGALFGVNDKAFQSAELGRSESMQERIVQQAQDVWGIARDWFLDGQYTHPKTGEAIDPRTFEPVSSNSIRQEAPSQADVPFYGYHSSGRLLLVSENRTAKVDADLKSKGAFVVLVSDEDNSPRIQAGRQLIVCPQPFYSSGNLVLVEHPTQRVEVGSRMIPVCYVRVYGNEGSRKTLRPLNSRAETFEHTDAWRIVGLVIGLRHEVTPGWTITERCDTGLPTTAPFVS